MNRNTLNLISVTAVIIVMIIAGTIYAFVDSKSTVVNTKIETEVSEPVEKEPKNEPGNQIDQSKSPEKQPVQKPPVVQQADYKKVYTEYLRSHYEYFDHGMVMCDLNEDGIPEVFSITMNDDGATELLLHAYRDGSVIEPDNDTPGVGVNIDNILKETTFYLDPCDFTGLYREKSSGKKAIISSYVIDSTDRSFDIATYDGKKLSVIDDDISRSVYEVRDSVMAGYEMCDEILHTAIQLRGAVDPENVVSEFNELATEFEKNESVKFDKATDGEMKCYIRNIDITAKKADLIPVAEISYDDYNKAFNSGNMYQINGVDCAIRYNEGLDAEFGQCVLFEMPWFEYYFDIPYEENTSGVIYEYFRNTPVRLKISDDLKITYPGEAMETQSEFTLEEYLPHYAEYKFRNYCVATIKNGELIKLDVLYHP